jgi:hypothetical protein
MGILKSLTGFEPLVKQLTKENKMATRCQIQVKGSPILIYKHNDDYPEGVLPTLEPMVKAFSENRGNDIEYCLAQIIRRFAIADFKDDPEYTQKTFTGWGLDCEIHGDIEYFYVVDAAKGSVTVQTRDFHTVDA